MRLIGPGDLVSLHLTQRILKRNLPLVFNFYSWYPIYVREGRPKTQIKYLLVTCKLMKIKSFDMLGVFNERFGELSIHAISKFLFFFFLLINSRLFFFNLTNFISFFFLTRFISFFI